MIAYYVTRLERPGDEAAFIAFYHEYLPFFTRRARRYLTGHGGLVDDALQETWIDVARDFIKLSSLPRHELPSYLATMVRHNCIDILRKERGHTELPEDETVTAGDETLNIVLQNDSLSRAAACIRGMPDIYRAVLEHRLLWERSNQEVAKKLGISEALAAKRFERGMKLLRETAQKEEATDE